MEEAGPRLKFWLELQVSSVEHPFGEAIQIVSVSAAGGWGSEEQISWRLDDC